MEGTDGSLLLIGLSRGACEDREHGKREKTIHQVCLGPGLEGRMSGRTDIPSLGTDCGAGQTALGSRE